MAREKSAFVTPVATLPVTADTMAPPMPEYSTVGKATTNDVA
jgi:hypothetical protein